VSDRPPLAAILVPTHDHAATLDLAVHSALEQTVTEIEVVVIGDGVGDDTREVAARLTQEDPRVRFLDFPKGPRHGEVHRATAVDGTSAEIVCYLSDDDLLLPGHVESMLEVLADADLAHSQNGRFDVDGSWRPYLSDLSAPRFREWELRPNRNAVSLTGAAHTVAAYRRLPYGWRTTPPDRWTDHYMWQQFLAEPWVRAVTATRVTVVQFPSHEGGRAESSGAERRAELEDWRDRLSTEEGRARFEEEALRCTLAEAAAEHVMRDEAEEALADAKARLGSSEARVVEAETRLEIAEAHAADAAARLHAVESTRTWRLRERLQRLAPLRALARATGRDRGR
jgi:GalNAc5-diNAcBac-PP-undecaprenol beta-1,3-glucosyltransferase